MAFTWQSIAGKDRRQFETYESLPSLQDLGASYYGSNGGFHGYLGGINYVYFLQTDVGQITFSLRNIFSTFYGGLAADGGNFDFDEETILILMAQVTTPSTLSEPVGDVVFSESINGINMTYSEGGTIVAFPANAQIHLQVKFLRDSTTTTNYTGTM